MTRDSVTTGPIGSEHFERWHEVRRQAFGATDAFDAAVYGLIPPDRVIGAFVDGTLMAATVVYGYRQQWGSESIPCGGVSGVVVAPEARGHGLARRLLGAHLTDMRERGEVVAALYPTTASLYRSLGFEMAGDLVTRTIPNFTVPTQPASTLRWQRIDFDDPRIAQVDATAASARSGWLERDPTSWERMALRWQSDTNVNRFAYVGQRDEVDAAVLVYRYTEPDDPRFGVFYALETDVVAAIDTEAWAAAFAFLAMQSTTSADIITDVPGSALFPILPQPQRSLVRESKPWMLRLVDLPGAIQLRRVPSSVTGAMSVSVVDQVVGANSRTWTLEVADGAAALTPGGDEAVATTVQTLARIYAGGDVASLAAAGLLPGASGDDLDLLAATFAGTPDVQFSF